MSHIAILKKSPVQITFDYRDLATDDRGFVKERALLIRDTAKRTAQGIILIGQWLTEAKARIKHGQWLPWLETEFGWSQPTAWRFMNVFDQVKLCTVKDLEIDVSALYLIAAPKTPEPVREEIIRRAEAGEPMTKAKAVEVLESYQKRADVQRVASDQPVAASHASQLTSAHVQSVADSLSGLIDECRKERSRAGKPAATTTPRPSRQELQAQREEMRVNGEHARALMVFVEAIEALSTPSIPIEQAARELRKMDTRDKDFRGQAVTAAQNLARLSKEMNT